MYYEALKSPLRFIAQLNEFTLIFNVWIISPLVSSEIRARSSLLGSTLRSIGYAVSESLYTLLLARLPVNPAFYFFMATGAHGFQIYWLWIMSDCVANLRLRNKQRDDEEASDYGGDAEKKLALQESHRANTKGIDRKVLYAFVFSFIQTPAASNAALLLAAQTVEHAEMKSYAVHVILLVAGLF